MSALTLAVLIIAGCGGDDGSDTQTASQGQDATAETGGDRSPPTKSRFAKRAKAICTQERERAVAIADRTRPKKQSGFEATPGAFEETIRASLVPTMESDIERISALGAPNGQQEQVESMLEAMQGVIDATMEPEGESRFAEALQLLGKEARSLGLPACGLS
jgi:hypothetical protein